MCSVSSAVVEGSLGAAQSVRQMFEEDDEEGIYEELWGPDAVFL